MGTFTFQAMACPCEVLIDTEDAALGSELFRIAETEARRIEAKFSRYQPDNITHQINASQGKPVRVDAETAQLLSYADQCYQMSDHLFDVTTGVLRRAWSFNGGNLIPSPETIQGILALVGWGKVIWKPPFVTLRPGMEIDFGGIGKEYAVDRALQLIRERHPVAALVNFGGDIAAAGQRRNGEPWMVGVEAPDQEGVAVRLIQMKQGGLTTSGDSKKLVLKDGKRYGHILNPLTGYPVEQAPRSVTVAAGTCSEAGFLSTLGMLQGQNAEAFLEQAGVRFWCYR